MNDTVITLVGNLVDDPELRFTPTGQVVARFRVASNPRYRDRQTGEWRDGEGLFLTCNAWREQGENVAESLRRGLRVIVQGRLRQRTYETKDGDKRTVMELEVDEVGPALRHARARVTRVVRDQPAQAAPAPAAQRAGEGQEGAAAERMPAMAGAGADEPGF